MPHYYFDVRANDLHVRDEVGIDLPNQHAIWPEIARLVHDCIYAAPLVTEGRVLDISVRDETGIVIQRCTSTVPACEENQRAAEHWHAGPHVAS